MKKCMKNPFFRITSLYAGYCLNLPHAVTLVEEMCLADPGLQDQLNACQATATPATFPLSSHLVIPFQRFLKYHLILKEILKYTDEDLYGGTQFVNLNKVLYLWCSQEVPIIDSTPK